MSYQGRYLRGEKYWYANRDANGNLKPELTEDEDRMKDVNLFLENREKEEKAGEEEIKEEKKSKSKGKK